MDAIFFRITGLVAITGAVLYAVGDVLLLAGKSTPGIYPKLERFAQLLSGTERMMVLSFRRMAWGALIGVFSTPLILSGFWQVYQGLDGGNDRVALTTFILFGTASVIGTFVHGVFTTWVNISMP